jgi:hypothetical protein
MTLNIVASFLAENYFWLLIIFIVLVMALIGYIADKQGIVKLKIEAEVEKKPKDIVVQPIVINNEKETEPVVNDMVVEPIVTNEEEIEKIDFSKEFAMLGIETKEEVIPSFKDITVPEFNEPVIEKEEETKAVDDVWKF